VSRLLNVHAPCQLAELSRDIGAKLVFFSTDYVYDGTAGPYKESDAPNPMQVYGMHKLETETFLLKNIPHALIIRSAWIYSQDPNPRNFVFRIVQQLEAGQVVKAAIDQINTPTDSDDLARRAIRAVRRNAEGILHIVGTERLSRYELTRKIADQHGFSDALIEPITTASLKLPARRPLNGGLVTQYTLGV
jgi:dTDP-4-dehydrorhamnose reductase